MSVCLFSVSYTFLAVASSLLFLIAHQAFLSSPYTSVLWPYFKDSSHGVLHDQPQQHHTKLAPWQQCCACLHWCCRIEKPLLSGARNTSTAFVTVALGTRSTFPNPIQLSAALFRTTSCRSMNSVPAPGSCGPASASYVSKSSIAFLHCVTLLLLLLLSMHPTHLGDVSSNFHDVCSNPFPSPDLRVVRACPYPQSFSNGTKVMQRVVADHLPMTFTTCKKSATF